MTPRTWRAHKSAYPGKPTVRLHLPDGNGGGVFTLVATINGGLQDANEIADLFAAAPDLLEALKIAAERFRTYERLHRAKGTDEARDKAISNGDMAALCEAAITKAKGQP